MLVSEEQVAELEAEVAGLLGILELIEDDQAAEGIRCYAEQVGRIGLVAESIGLPGLQQVCQLFQNDLAALGGGNRALGELELARLEEWPILVIGYLGSPTDPQAGEPLIDPALPAAEAEALRHLLAGEAQAPDTAGLEAEKQPNLALETMDEAPPPVVLAPSALLESTSVVGTFAPAEPFLIERWASIEPIEQPIEAIRPVEQPIEAIGEVEGKTEVKSEEVSVVPSVGWPESMAPTVHEEKNYINQSIIEDKLATQAEAVIGLEPQADADDTVNTVDKVEEQADPADFIDKVKDQADALDLADEAEDQADAPDLADEAEEQADALDLADEAEDQDDTPDLADEAEERADADGDIEAIEDESEDNYIDDEDEDEDELVAATAGPSEAYQELLDILCAEISQISENTKEVLALAAAVETTSADRSEALFGYAEHLERLGDASASIGLTGLQQACLILQANVSQLATQDHPLDEQQRSVVEIWPDLALDYLQALGDPSACAALISHLQDGRWPQPLAVADTDALIDLLVAPTLSADVTEGEARQRQAQAEDVSLALPADVNQELLDGLLQELPYQAAEFSATIQRLAAGGGQPKDVEVAQRIAHTLKGAGNTVGVRGIATLTHHMEDILQALSKHGALPNRALSESLLNAADCLEAMSEALLGISDPPSQALTVLQEVLDWANRIDTSGVPAQDDNVSVAVVQSASAERIDEATPPVEAPQQPGAAPVAEVTLRVPAHLVDEVLRLVGESIILTGQVQERIRKTVAQTRSVMGQNRLFQQLTAELEQLVDIRNVSSPLAKSMQRGGFDPLELEQYNELNTVTHRLVEAVTDTHQLGRSIEDNLAALDALLVDQGRLHRDSQEAVLRTRMVPIQTVAPRLQRSVRQTCRMVDKEAELVVYGTDTLIDSNVLNDMVDPLMHVLRNAVDHGIEAPALRRQMGKPPIGRIELSFGREGNNIAVRCQDDGAGLDLEAIRQTAIERGLLNPEQLLSDDELTRLILLPGFSTRSAATQTSGRGIGMDMVYSRLLEMKGSLRIQSQAGKGCLMELRLPVTFISTHALLLRLRDQVVALSDRGIEQILYSGIGTIQRLGKVATYQVGDEVYELTSIDTLLNLPPDHRAQNRSAPPVLLVREETGAIRAVLAQDIMDSRDLVVKNLGQYLPRLNGIIGATILGDGSVVPVLDLPELLRAPVTGQPVRAVTRAGSGGPSAQDRPFILAVDDSLSARRSLAQFAQDAGFEVRTARDGLEAIEVIKGRHPSLILADLEMPRMNGLDLTIHLRANQATKDLPVIMITSRSTEKHRREAQTAGVDIYLTKPFRDEELLGHIHQLLQRT